MLKVAPLIKYLSENQPQQTPARLTFYNYLCHLAQADSYLGEDLLENFFATCLDYTHWQQNKAQLKKEIEHILECYSHATGTLLDLADVRWPDDAQVVEIENLRDLTDALQCYLNATYKHGEKYRIVVDSNQKVFAIVLKTDKSLEIRQFDKKMTIRHGQLEPLRQDLSLFYNSDLELDPNSTQKMEIAPFVTALFQVDEQGIHGCLVRGYACQKFFDLRGTGLQSHQKLFYAVKKIEQHFVNRESDPFYQEIVTSLERMNDLIRSDSLSAMETCMDVLAQAQSAYENVFMSDKLLGLLIRDLQHTLANRSVDKRTVVMTNRKAEDKWITSIKQTPPTLLTNSKIPLEMVENPKTIPKTTNPKTTSTISSTANLTTNQTMTSPAQKSNLQARILEKKYDLTN